MPEIDEVRNIANKTNASIIGISETKLDETILSSDPINQGEVVVLLLTLKVRLYIEMMMLINLNQRKVKIFLRISTLI